MCVINSLLFTDERHQSMQQVTKIQKDDLWRVPEIDNENREYVVMLHDPFGLNDELFQVMVKADEDGDLEEIIFHDARAEDFGNIVEATLSERYPRYVLSDVIDLIKFGLVPSWIRSQINKKVKELKKCLKQ